MSIGRSMAAPSSGYSADPSAAALEARRATADLLARIAARRRRDRRASRWRELLLDLAVAMATYAGLTIAVVLGAGFGFAQLFG